MTIEEVLVYTRRAADLVGATKMDRPEDVEPNPRTGKVYVALTNNSARGTSSPLDEANPISGNRFGHVIELTETAGQAGETDKGQVHLLETESGTLLRTISGHQYGVTDLRFTADGKHVLSVGRDTTLRICRVEDGQEPILGCGCGGQPSVIQVQPLLVALLEVRQDQVVFGGEVVVEAHLGHAGLGNDPVDAHGPHAFLIEQPVGRFQDALPGL